MEKIEIKKGDSFSPLIQVAEDNGSIINIAGWSILSQVRDRLDTLIDTLTVSNKNNSAGTFNLVATNTSNWPVGELFWDIEYTNQQGIKVSTETILIKCNKDVSRV